MKISLEDIFNGAIVFFIVYMILLFFVLTFKSLLGVMKSLLGVMI